MMQRYDRGVPYWGTPHGKDSKCVVILFVENRNGPVSQIFCEAVVWIRQDEIGQLGVQDDILIINDDIICIWFVMI